ncbi:MAG TPA: amidohydrolase [Thermoanaerobaculia bacterium]|nr:amidohydrolase [Thermoanaerobaculia bacterium]
MSPRPTVLALLFALALLPSPPARAARPEPADLVIRGGRIVTMSPTQPEVRALAVRGERIVAVGSEQEIAPLVGRKTRVIELAGRMVMPGFIEGHGHFLGLGFSRMQLDLRSAQSWDDVVAMVAAAVAKAQPGEWILGRGWHQEKWQRMPEPNVEGIPFHQSLSAVSPDNPVLLEHASGHATFANAKAMALAGVTRETRPPAGGEILRDAAGEPTGLFRETAADLVARKTPESSTELQRAIELAGRECLEKGITSFQDAGSSVQVAELLRDQALAGKLPVRLWLMLSDSSEVLARELPRVKAWEPHPYFAVGGIKRYMDGALGSHGAWLLAPYSDLPSSTGLRTTPAAELEATARLALDHDLQLCVHAIGDRANRETLDLYERTFARYRAKADRRWRIEHAQHLDPADIPRFAQLGVIASMQTVHATSDGPWVPARLGPERSKAGAYVWRKLLQRGAVLVNGTDTPVEDVDPLANLVAAITRRMANGEVFYPAERLTLAEALKAMTASAAWAAFQEGEKGTLAPGKLADLVVLTKDLFTLPESEIPATRVAVTILGGRVVHERP